MSGKAKICGFTIQITERKSSTKYRTGDGVSSVLGILNQEKTTLLPPPPGQGTDISRVPSGNGTTDGLEFYIF